MKIGVIGIGVVGSAVYRSLSEKCGDSNDVIPYDKYKNIGSLDDVLNTDIVFLCLPTPYSYELASYDKTSMHDVCEKLSERNYKGVVVLKSTVEPTTSQTVADKYNLSVMHNPEFLSAVSAYEDFHNQNHIIIGTTSSSTEKQLNMLVDFYKKHYPNAQISICSSTESESGKIFCNCFYAVKVQFFNEMYLLCQKLNIDYQIVKDLMLRNNWINPMHTNVPGPDGKLSYGGMCFPKDTNALLSFMKSIQTPCAVLESSVTERNLMRED